MDSEARRERVPVGSLLRSCRLRAGVTLADAAETLNIRRPYLDAIEEGRYGDLPGPTYALGFVRGYAEYLGLDGNEVTRRFRAETAGIEQPGTKVPGAKRPGLKRPRTKAMLQFPLAASETASPKAGVLLVGVMIALVAYGGWYALTAGNGFPPNLIAPLPARLAALLPDARVAPDPPSPQTLPPLPKRAPVDPAPVDPDAPKEQQSESPAPATASAGRPAPERLMTAEAAPSEPMPSEAMMPEAEPTLASGLPSADPPVADLAGADSMAAAEGAAAEGPRVILQASQESWVEIRDRFNKRVVSRLMAAGDHLEVPDEAGLRLTVGNAGGLVIKVDGQAVPPLGGPGVVLRDVSLEAARLQHADAGAN
ncbi:MAG: RodZ domain-containing protein [Hyphomicrobium sp.]